MVIQVQTWELAQQDSLELFSNNSSNLNSSSSLEEVMLEEEVSLEVRTSKEGASLGANNQLNSNLELKIKVLEHSRALNSKLNQMLCLEDNRIKDSIWDSPSLIRIKEDYLETSLKVVVDCSRIKTSQLEVEVDSLEISNSNNLNKILVDSSGINNSSLHNQEEADSSATNNSLNNNSNNLEVVDSSKTLDQHQHQTLAVEEDCLEHSRTNRLHNLQLEQAFSDQQLL